MIIFISLLYISASWAQNAPSGKRNILLNKPIRSNPSVDPLTDIDVKPFLKPKDYVLPPLKTQDLGPHLLSDAVLIQSINIMGNTILPEELLQQLKQPYLNKKNTLEQLFELKNKLTKLYIDQGYVTSGALIDEKSVVGNELTLLVIEGRLVQIEVEGNQWLSDYFLLSRLDFGDRPFNSHELELKLQIMRQHYMIETLHAELKPGINAGEVRLKLKMDENNPFKAKVFYDNHRSPSIGAEMYGITIEDRSLAGLGDTLQATFGESKGATNYSVSYSIPFTRYDTRLTLSAAKEDNTIVIAPFNALDIESKDESLMAQLSQPLFRDIHHNITTSVSYRWHKTGTFLLGDPFTFSAGANQGESVVHTINFNLNYVYRDSEQVIALSSSLSRGLDIGKATIRKETPDAKFWAWLGQAQWVRRLPFFDSQIMFRSGLRLTDDEMLSTEKFAIGGANTVRGYRENFLTRDQGVFTSLEYQIPLPWKLPIPWISRKDQDGTISLALFADYGYSWNKNAGKERPQDIASIGTGIIWQINRESSAELYYAGRLRNIPKLQNDELQDEGIHFQINFSPF